MKRSKCICSVLLLIAVVGICLSGCSVSKIAHGIQSGTYTMQGMQDETAPPSITFDVETRTFIFSFDAASSYLSSGTWDFKDEKVVVKTDDCKYSYIFEVVDSNTIRFVQEGSSQIVKTDDTKPIIDGTEFEFCGKTKPADDIVLPSADKVTKIEIINGDTATTTEDKEVISNLIKEMETAKDTGKESVNDRPVGDTAVEIKFEVADGEISTVFMYFDGGALLLEQPYQGIYSVDKSLADTVSNIK